MTTTQTIQNTPEEEPAIDLVGLRYPDSIPVKDFDGENSPGDLFEKVVTKMRTDTALGNAMIRINRWTAYQKLPEVLDTNGYGHAFRGLQIADEMLAADTASGLVPDDLAHQLRTAQLIHDLGETTFKDITYGGKSKADEAEEALQLSRVIDNHFPEFSNFEREELKSLYNNIVEGDKKHDLAARYFSMIEVAGYTTFSTDMFEMQPESFDWEVLAWRVLAYHIFGTDDQGVPRDIPDHCQWSEGAKEYWSARIDKLDAMVEHFRGVDQESFLREKYAFYPLPDVYTVKPIDLDRWSEIRDFIVG
jgi:5'-deoxynucleotidase YfbR-like HD superfamily hydrolase